MSLNNARARKPPVVADCPTSIDEALRQAEQQGHSVKYMRQKLDHWVKTGKFPDGSEVKFKLE